MTVQTEYVPVEYVGNNSTSTPYVITFPFNADADVFVKLKDADDIVTDLVNGIDFTVSGSNVTTTIAYDSTYRLVIGRITEVTQLTDYVENDSFPAASHEAALDKLTLIAQELTETFARVPRLSPAQGTSGDITPATNDSFIYIDTSGNFVALTAVQVATLLSVAGGVGVNYTKVWADDAARASTLPEFEGQLGVQLDKTGSEAIYRSTGTSIGNWAQVHDPAEKRFIKVTYVTTSSTFNFDALTTLAIVELLGGGGGGGGAAVVASGVGNAGNGGSAGGWLRKTLDVALISPKSATVVIGAGGIGVSGTTGTNGGTTTWTDSVYALSANGGIGADAQTGASGILVSGDTTLGTAPTSGDINRRGDPGSGVFEQGNAISATATNVRSGRGGSSHYGSGGRAIIDRSATAASTNGENATGYGAGGGGATSINGAAAKPGGNGSPGICIVYEYA